MKKTELKMQKIIIQKKYLIIVEVAENMYRLFLVIVSFIFNVDREQANEVVVRAYESGKSSIKKVSDFCGDVINSFKNYFYNLFSYKDIELVQIKTKTNDFKKSFKNNDFLIHSNLLAPPYNNFK